LVHQVQTFLTFFFKILFIYLRKSEKQYERGECQREKQTPQWARSPIWGSIPGLRDHDLSRRQTSNWLSHPGAPNSLVLKKNVLPLHTCAFTLVLTPSVWFSLLCSYSEFPKYFPLQWGVYHLPICQVIRTCITTTSKLT